MWKYAVGAKGAKEELPVYDPSLNPNAGDKVYRQLQCGPNFKVS